MSENDNSVIEESRPLCASVQQSNDAIGRQSASAKRNVSQDDAPLSLELVQLLQIVSCLRKYEKTKIDMRLLTCAVGNLDTDVLEEAISKKQLTTVVEKDEQDAKLNGDQETTGADKNYYYFHDKEKEEQVYGFIPQREELHVVVGMRLLENNNVKEEALLLDEAIVVHQFLLGESFFLRRDGHNSKPRTSPKEESLLVRVASQCLSVGRRAVRTSSDFETATTCFNFGIRTLNKIQPTCWNREYQLCLELHCAAAEANYAMSNFEHAQTIIDELISNARTFQDTWGIHATQIYVLGALGKRHEAIAVGLNVSKQVNESVMEHPKLLHVLCGFIRIRRKLQNKTPESILRLPTMDNAEKLVAMQMLNLILCHAIPARPYLAPVLVFRLVELTLTHGLSVMSSVAFANYAMILAKFGTMEEAYRFSDLALTLYKRYPVPEWLPRVHLGVHGSVYSCIKDIQCTIEPLKYATRVGLTTGDNEVAFINGHICTYNQFTIGENLDVMEKETAMYYEETITRKLTWLSHRFAVSLQFFRNLMEESASLRPTCMFGAVLTEEMYEGLRTNDMMMFLVFRFHKLVLCYLFGDYKGASEISNWYHDLKRITPSQHGIFTYLFLFDGLASIAEFQDGTAGHGKVRSFSHKLRVNRKVRHHIQSLKRQSLINPNLCSGKLYLLQAEAAAWLSRNHDEAIFKYTSAIHVSSGADIKLDLALAHERAGRYKLFHGDQGVTEGSSKHHFQEAVATYRTWGAHVKAKQLEKEVAKLYSEGCSKLT